MTTWIHPYCNVCGWRKGGRDSWDGKACKCGDTAPMITLVGTPEEQTLDSDPKNTVSSD